MDVDPRAWSRSARVAPWRGAWSRGHLRLAFDAPSPRNDFHAPRSGSESRVAHRRRTLLDEWNILPVHRIRCDVRVPATRPRGLLSTSPDGGSSSTVLATPQRPTRSERARARQSGCRCRYLPGTIAVAALGGSTYNLKFVHAREPSGKELEREVEISLIITGSRRAGLAAEE